MDQEMVFSNDESITKCDEEYAEQNVTLVNNMKQLTSEIDNYKQEVYDLQRKLNGLEQLYKETVEDNELSLNNLKNSLEKRTKELTDKNKLEKENHCQTIKELESALEESKKEKKSLNEEIENIKNGLNINDKSQTSILQSFDEEEKFQLQNEIEEWKSSFENETRKNAKLKEEAFDLESEVQNLKELLKIAKETADEKSELLESVREELIMSQSELNSLKSRPKNTCNKGNSVFAELEDSRNKIISQMNQLKSEYVEMKRHHKVLESENAKLKSEKAKLIREWNEESNAILVKHKEYDNSCQDALLALQRNLEIERKQCRTLMENKLQNPNISFLQVQLSEQKKEMDKLRTQMEAEYYMKTINQSNMDKLSKEIRYWKYKALNCQENYCSKKIDEQLSEEEKSTTDVFKYFNGSLKKAQAHQQKEKENLLLFESVHKEPNNLKHHLSENDDICNNSVKKFRTFGDETFSDSHNKNPNKAVKFDLDSEQLKFTESQNDSTKSNNQTEKTKPTSKSKSEVSYPTFVISSQTK